jgi:hypothetical protein
MKLGYALFSTEDQTLQLQRTRLKEAGCEKVFEEKISGAARKRSELEKLLGEVRKGDVLRLNGAFLAICLPHAHETALVTSYGTGYLASLSAPV